MFKKSAWVLAFSAASILVVAPVSAEVLPDADAKALVGNEITGPNWTVDAGVGRDGFMRIYSLTTPYGQMDVIGQRRLTDRLAELRALDKLEKVSKTETFVNALAKAGLAPLKFGRDLVVDPLATTERLFEGVANIFDRADAELSNTAASRDGTIASILGVQKARRELAYELGVDPYTDFKPLDDGLDGVAEAMAAGDVSISAAIMAIPGGAGVAVSGTATANQLSQPLRDKSSAEIAKMVKATLEALGVSKEAAEAFVVNKYYTPADQFAVAESLKLLGAKEPGLFVERATKAINVDDAKFQRTRIETMARESGKLGTLTSFVSLGDYTLNRNAKGALVAVFPFDEIAWSALAERSFTRLHAEIKKLNEKSPPTLAVTGKVSAPAATELAKQGWTIVALK
jgi:hypothetical protein